MRVKPFMGLALLVLGQVLAAGMPELTTSSLAAMKWRQVGPFRGGRVLAVTGVPGDPNTFYFGGVAGGVWKTTNGGHSWVPMFDSQDIASIGALAVAPSEPNTVYVGTGEACIRGNISYGTGVYKSNNGGKTWASMGLRDTRHIGRVVVDPKNPDRVFVAALDHAYGPNAERGVFRTVDGGAHWQKVLFKDVHTGAIDVQFDPTNSNVLYAALWQVQRTPWSLSSGGPGSGLYKSVDGGSTWKLLSGGGLPAGIYGRIGLAISPVDPDRIWASIEAAEGGLYRSEDGGTTWARINADERFRQRAWYFSHLVADPKALDTVYALNTGAFRSIDGGKTFELLPAPHGDHHGLWIDPTEPKRMINGNDGGATITVDGGKTWTTQLNQPTAQFYHVTVDQGFPYRLFGTQQDNSSVAIKSYSDAGVIEPRDWQEFGGETGTVAPDPRNPDIVFWNNEHTIGRTNLRTGQTQDVSVDPLDVSGRGAAELSHRFQWTSPLLAPPTEPGVLYTAGEAVFRSTDDGHSWEQISGDLTRNDKTKQQPSGGPIQLDITSVEYYDTIFALAVSPRAKGLLWAGTDDGLVWLTRDGGKAWKKVTPPGLPEWGTVSQIDASAHAEGRAYVAVDRHRMDDFKAYAWRTQDFGATWTAISAGLPESAYMHAVREDPRQPGLLYAATELGVYVSFDDGARWQAFSLNLPMTPVNDLVIQGDDLVAATNGRGFWILDNLSPLRQIAGLRPTEVHLFKPTTALRLAYNLFPDRRRAVGSNGPQGAVFDYWLPTAPKGEVALEVLDSQGAVLRRLSSKPAQKGPEQPPEWVDIVKPAETLSAQPGLNRIVWDLRHAEPTQIPGAIYEGLPPTGPLVLPGNYNLRLSVDGQTQSQAFDVVNDPRSTASPAELRAALDLGLKTRALIEALHDTVNRLRVTRGQLKTMASHLGTDSASQALGSNIQALQAKLDALESELIQVKLGSSEGTLRFPTMLNEQLNGFRNVIEADAAPTRAQLELYTAFSKRLEAQLVLWRGLLEKDIPALNQQIVSGNLKLIDPNATAGSGSGAGSGGKRR